MTLCLRPYRAPDAEAWDRLVAESLAGTFLHSRRFLSYHGDRFEDASVCLYQRDALVGVFPAARDRERSDLVASHPGATYGGLIHAGALRGAACLEALEQLCAYYAQSGFRALHYKAVPRIYHRAPAEDDLYALYRLDARRYRCDLSVAIDLANRLKRSSRRKRAEKKALKAGIEVRVDPDALAELWDVLETNLRERHGTKPVHSREEIALLRDRLGEEIQFVVARDGESVLAGVVLFVTPQVLHAQYIAASARGHETNALDLVFEHCLSLAEAEGARYFNFGTCNEQAGRVLNDGLYRFKAEFGGAGVAHEFYELALSRSRVSGSSGP